MNKKKVLQFTALGFILSNIGAAVGLGNIWRFPERVLGGGGSSFILIYLIVVFLIALPVVILEINFGLFFKKGITKTFHKAGGVWGTILGWKQIFLIGFLCIFYLVVLSWIGVGFVLSLIPSFFKKWSSDKTWFDHNILKSTAPAASTQSVSNLRFSPWVLISICVLLLLIFLIVNAGIKDGLEKANYIFVPGLFVMLVGLTIYSLFFLKDGSAGAEALFKFESKKMKDPFIWYEAVKQAVFSTGIIFGILITFSKSSDVRMDKGNEAIIIVVADTFIGLISGLLVSALIANNIGQTEEVLKNGSFNSQDRFNHIAQTIKEKFQDDAERKKLGGSGLLLSYLPGLFLRINYGTSFGIGNALMIVFCLTLLFAGLSSIIGILEVFVHNLDENLPTKRTGNILLWMAMAIIFLVIYSSSIGPSLVGKQDDIILLFIILVGIGEISIFLLTPYYSKVIKYSDNYTFLKLGHWNWFRIFVALIVLPILLLMGVFGFMEEFGINYLIVNTDLYFQFKNSSKFWEDFYLRANKSQLKFDLPKLISYIMFAFSSFLTFLFAVFASSYQQDLDKQKTNLISKISLKKEVI